MTVSISSKAPPEPLNEPEIGPNISPGKEAIEILDDLCNALDCDASSSSLSPRRYQQTTPKQHTPNNDITTHAIRDLSNEYAKSASSTKDLLIRDVEASNKRNNVPQIAASFNVRPPDQSSRESTPKVQRQTTIEINSEPEIKVISVDQRHSREDSGVDSQEFTTIPPPEPEIDYPVKRPETSAPKVEEATPSNSSKESRKHSKNSSDEQIPANTSTSTSSSTRIQPKYVHSNGLLNRSVPNRATVTRKTRTYVVDGVQVTSTSLHVLGAQQDYALRLVFQLYYR